MNINTYSVFISAYEYDILSRNKLISMTCKNQLKSAIEHGDEIELIMKLRELSELIGFVAAEANHARSNQQSQILNEICDVLESSEEDIKRKER